MKTTEQDYEVIGKIVKRAIKLKLITRKYGIDLFMDLDCANENFNLRLTELLEADDFNFKHDIMGIQYYIDRKNKTFLSCFVPRFANN